MERSQGPASMTPSARATTELNPATAPHTAVAVFDLAWLCKRVATPAGREGDLYGQDHLPRGALIGEGEGRDVPKAGDDQEPVGGPGQAGEGVGQSFGASGPSERAVGSNPKRTIRPPTQTVAARTWRRSRTVVSAGDLPSDVEPSSTVKDTVGYFPCHWRPPSRRRRSAPPASAEENTTPTEA